MSKSSKASKASKALKQTAAQPTVVPALIFANSSPFAVDAWALSGIFFFRF